MGACVSSHHKSGSNRKHDNHAVIPPSPVKEKHPIIDDGNVAVKPQWPPLLPSANSRDFGSKEEMFFDSQAWLESDCESDFMSVNGEFTPSRGNTPVHNSFIAATLPIKRNKRLSELFSESRRENRNSDDEDGESANENVAAAVHGGVVKPKRERWVEIVRVPGCLPRVLSSCRPVAVTHQQEVGRK
ncbi:hypothetical protein L1987_36506 [Smallanthus sonchifolius]|uniref:Uncharacterized protein n=1 Tax=Smallanthus sonchifolius TaxID=185202 RepID=A0ACB9HDC9_9ASTR|nr:hypothetical protein L1987_36506 [Smallanthus sonchifolius]